jgi:hypothetical protein
MGRAMCVFLERGASMRRRVLILSALFLALAIAPAATAGQPTREVFPALPDEVLDLCGFPVLDHEEGYAVVESFTDDQGNLVRQIITAPGLRETFTNLDTGKTIVLNNEGPGVRVLNPDGSFRSFTGTGPFVFYFNPFTLGPGLFYATGRFVIARDANGNRTFEIVGTITDVCAELAA